MKYHFLFLSFFICLILKGQSFYFGPKVGPSLAFQKWNQTDNDFLFALNGDIFIESAPLESTNVFMAHLVIVPAAVPGDLAVPTLSS